MQATRENDKITHTVIRHKCTMIERWISAQCNKHAVGFPVDLRSNGSELREYDGKQATQV